MTPSVPPVVVRAAQRFAATSRGTVAFVLHRVFDVRAGVSRRHEDLVLDVVVADGAISSVRVVRYTIDGKNADAATQEALVQKYEHPAPTDVFRVPFDPRNLYAYRYAAQAPGVVAFTALVRDAAHGDGTFSYDSHANVVSYRYAPSALPQYANNGNVTDVRSPVLPNYWSVVQEDQQYGGHYGPFAGHATVSITFSGFRRLR